MTTQVPALNAMMLGQASDTSVRQDRPVEQRILHRRRRRRQRTFVLVDGNFGNVRYRTFLLPRVTRKIPGSRAHQYFRRLFDRAVPFS